MGQDFDATDRLAINTIRTLSMDAVQAANSGHPGAPMGLAPVAWTLFSRVLKHDPADPGWADRDRFILSNGHASMLLYSVLHLTGYDLPMEQLKQFRQWGSSTAGHPEYGHAPGVEVTTGPLGQGCANSVGMALAEANLAETFGSSDHPVVNHRTWVLCGDGCLMEGVSAEAASLAGHLGLAKLTWIWDDNRITIDGGTELSISEDTEARFRAYGWQVLRVDDANDLPALLAAFQAAKDETERPTFIAVRTNIAYGSPNKQDTAGAHGAPLGDEEITATKAYLGWTAEPFTVPEEVFARGREIAARGAEAHQAWQAVVESWRAGAPTSVREFERRLSGRLPEGWAERLTTHEAADRGPATRAASGVALNSIADALPELIGGSADLNPSCKTELKSSGIITRDSLGERNLHFGIREHAMGAILNGLALHGGFRPLGSTFLVFADYMRPPIRLAALMGLPVVFVFTHDSIWVGEDGPTHQPVEHVASLRAIPNLVVIRPADANETAAAWRAALERTAGPTALILSRQGLPVLPGSDTRAMAGVAAGAWVVSEPGGLEPAVTLVATGSEVALATQAAWQLGERGVGARVVSMPSRELFAEQDTGTRQAILPPGLPVVGRRSGHHRRLGGAHRRSDAVLGINRFGASAPGAVVAEKLGLTAEALVERALHVIGR
jgi:transketolase